LEGKSLDIRDGGLEDVPPFPAREREGGEILASPPPSSCPQLELVLCLVRCNSGVNHSI